MYTCTPNSPHVRLYISVLAKASATYIPFPESWTMGNECGLYTRRDQDKHDYLYIVHTFDTTTFVNGIPGHP